MAVDTISPWCSSVAWLHDAAIYPYAAIHTYPLQLTCLTPTPCDPPNTPTWTPTLHCHFSFTCSTLLTNSLTHTHITCVLVVLMYVLYVELRWISLPLCLCWLSSWVQFLSNDVIIKGHHYWLLFGLGISPHLLPLPPADHWHHMPLHKFIYVSTITSLIPKLLIA